MAEMESMNRECDRAVRGTYAVSVVVRTERIPLGVRKYRTVILGGTINAAIPGVDPAFGRLVFGKQARLLESLDRGFQN